MKPAVARSLLATLWCLTAAPLGAQVGVSLLYNMSPDSNALVLPTSGSFSNVINGRSHQREVLITHDGYQYTAWYHNGTEQDIYVSRRNLSGNVWETIDTGYDMENGNLDWDSHNAIAMGISGDGRIHLAYDHHVDPLRYLVTDAGFATSPSQVWSQGGFAAERSSLNPQGSAIPRVTYPQFSTIGDDLVFTYRDFTSGNGNMRLASYDTQTGQWSGTHDINRGRSGNGVYDDVNQNPSGTRNAYHNAFQADPTGRLHTTWTWREGTQDGNHDLMYAYSDDRGVTWRNNDGQPVGTPSSPVTLTSAGIEVVDLDRRQALFNQQGQAVDPLGGVHAVMFHREPGHEFTDSPMSDRGNSRYYHYYRDPASGDWVARAFPADARVGSDATVAADRDGNLFAVYVQGGDLVIAGLERSLFGYGEWEMLHREQTRNYVGSPRLDERRLRDEGVLSVYVQQQASDLSPTGPTGSPLYVMDFQTSTPDNAVSHGVSSDGSLRYSKSTGEVSGEDLGFVLSSTELNIGQSGTAAAPYDRAAVMVFQLPDLGAIDDPFAMAGFQSHVTQRAATEGLGGDLYGIDRRDSPEILASDYYGRSDTPDPDARLLQDDFLTDGVTVGATIRTSATGGGNLVDYLNDQYAGGQGAGEYVFLRVNVDAETTERWSLASANATDPALRPQLLYRALEGVFLDGDYNRDGVVDAADYTVWRDRVGSPAGSLMNDPTGESIGPSQYAVWRAQFGATGPASTATVPEPALQAWLAALALAGSRRARG